jgi:glycerol-3-phosphate dehydrogenase
MRRDPRQLEGREFDLAVVGGGVFGICTAWDAALRGLSVALIERADFVQATSAHSFRMVHGGIRYLQHGDFARIRESVRERRALIRMAPHLVEPLPIVIPTYGHGLGGKPALGLGLRLYDVCAADRNRGIHDPDRQIPPGRVISRTECLHLFPELESNGLTGAGLFYDGQMYNPPRLAFSILRSAVDAGAVAVNYVAARRFTRRNNRITGVSVADTLTGDELEVRAKVVVNTAGGWAPQLLQSASGLRLSPGVTFSRDTCFVLKRRAKGPHALAILGQTRDPDALVSRAARHLFLAPWRGYTLLGVWHKPWLEDPDSVTVTEAELFTFLGEVNASSPALRITPDDVGCCDVGLVLFGDNAEGAANLRYGHRSRVVDHRATDGVEGLITSIGVRWTTARGVAEQVVTLAGRKLGRSLPPSPTARTPVHGGAISDIKEFVQRTIAERPAPMGEEAARSLARNHGAAVGEVLAHIRRDPALATPLDGSHVVAAEVVHAAREEMAQRLADVVYRRTDLGTAERPTRAALETCARLVAAELGWSPERIRTEISNAERAFPVASAAPPATTPAVELSSQALL